MAPPQEHSVTENKIQEYSPTLSERIRALPQELADMIHDAYVSDTDIVPTHCSIQVNLSYRIPTALHVNQALRKKLRVTYYTTNTFILENTTVNHKWCWAMFEYIEYGIRTTGPPKGCDTCGFPCGWRDNFVAGFWLQWRIYEGTQWVMEDMKWKVKIEHDEPRWRSGQRAQWDRCLPMSMRESAQGFKT